MRDGVTAPPPAASPSGTTSASGCKFQNLPHCALLGIAQPGEERGPALLHLGEANVLVQGHLGTERLQSPAAKGHEGNLWIKCRRFYLAARGQARRGEAGALGQVTWGMEIQIGGS